jgi:hypothetical protein
MVFAASTIGVFTDGQRLRRHDFGDLAAILVNEIGRLLARAENELQKPAAPALCADFAATKEVAFRNDTDELAGRINYRKSADMPPQHGVCRVGDRGIGCDGDNRPSHDLVSTHCSLRWFEIEFVSCKLFRSADRDLMEIKG